MLKPTVSPRQVVTRLRIAWVLFVAISTGLFSSTIFLLTQGLSFPDLGSQFLGYAFANPDGLDQTLTRSIPLILVGLSVALGLRVKFWNIGVEGQLWIGALSATAVAIYHIGPEALRLETMLLAAMLGGGVWCGICALGRLYLRASEVVSTLLMNYIGNMLALQLLYGPWRNPSDAFPVSETFGSPERLPLLGFGHVHAGILVAIAAAGLCFWLCSYSSLGICARAVAANPRAARALGISVNRTVLIMAVLAGALSGAAGFIIVAGEEYKLTQFVGHDFIFPSVVIAYLARANAMGVMIASIAVAALYTAGDSLKVFYQLPGATVLTIEATMLFFVSCSEFFLRYRVDWIKTETPLSGTLVLHEGKV
jgi:ABC-type uncharacterized transport system permease subunit